MIKNVYHNGKLIPVKDWDFDTNRPKVKPAKEQPINQVVEEATEQITD
jgi:hypothetical protein